jgi:CRISPR-associated protein Cmr4
MFEAKSLLFYTCLTPLHMGAGTAIGAIDNPIQREVHSGHPLIAGSGIKGALRHHLSSRWQAAEIKRLFGPERDASEHAGALAFTDAQLVAFPVRALRGAFVWATCPYALARLKRLAASAGLKANWTIPEVSAGQAATAAPLQGNLILEAFEFTPQGNCGDIAQWLADVALPQGETHAFFRNKLKTDLVVLDDGDFNHFAKNATVVEPHVRIDDETGTAAKTGLFYTENLPPETILAGLVLASIERGKGEQKLPAKTILDRLLDGNEETQQPGIADSVVQMGGDATTGRGMVMIHPAREG